jgi:hypothetical protein
MQSRGDHEHLRELRSREQRGVHPGLRDRLCRRDGHASSHAVSRRDGALVFSAGTVQWSWGLDPNHDTETGIPPERANNSDICVGVDLKGSVKAIQQATLNLFADMGVQPATLQPGLVRAIASIDKVPPTSRVDVDSPRAISSMLLEASGTAVDTGGVVAGVDVSVDGARTWHPAEGTATWFYRRQVPAGAPRPVVLSRAVDDSGNIEVSSKPRTGRSDRE